MCAYRLWGLVAAFIGFYLTGFVIRALGLNTANATEWGIGVGIAIYLIPLILPRLLRNTKYSIDVGKKEE
jgi:hypothetical protein